MQLTYIILALAAVAALTYNSGAVAAILPWMPEPTPPEPQEGLGLMGTEYDQFILAESQTPPKDMTQAEFIRLINAIITIESAWRPSVVSSAGAIGLMQVMPANAVAYGYKAEDLYNPAINIKLGAEIIRTEINRFGLVDGLAAYNGGPNGRKWQSTQAYAQKVLGVYNSMVV